MCKSLKALSTQKYHYINIQLLKENKGSKRKAKQMAHHITTATKTKNKYYPHTNSIIFTHKLLQWENGPDYLIHFMGQIQSTEESSLAGFVFKTQNCTEGLLNKFSELLLVHYFFFFNWFLTDSDITNVMPDHKAQRELVLAQLYLPSVTLLRYYGNFMYFA